MKSLIFAAALLTAGAAYRPDSTVPAGQHRPRARRARRRRSSPTPPPRPAGANQPIPPLPPGAVWVPNPNAARPPSPPQPSTGEKPPCSRTVTDNCTQTYERRRRRQPRR